MILEFMFSNFKSFKEKTKISFYQSRNTELMQHIISEKGVNAISVCAIYGPNASGKSNIYKALKYMSEFITFYPTSNKQSKNDVVSELKKFAFDNSSTKKDTSFEITFTLKKYDAIWNYGFDISKECIIHNEYLRVKKKENGIYKTILERKNNDFILNANFIDNIEKNMLEKVIDSTELLVTTGKKLKLELLSDIYDWFYNNEFADYGDIEETFFSYRTLPVDFVENERRRTNIAKFLSTFGTGIVGFKIEKLPKDSNGEVFYDVKTLHKNIDDGSCVELRLADESSGTLKLFSMYCQLKDVLNNGSVLFIDELNEKLHPAIVKFIITMFTNKKINKNNAQIVFTLHDISQLDKNNLRRDEIWFVEKNNEISSIYPLSNIKNDGGIKIRKDENYQKNYSDSKYGAYPNISEYGGDDY